MYQYEFFLYKYNFLYKANYNVSPVDKRALKNTLDYRETTSPLYRGGGGVRGGYAREPHVVYLRPTGSNNLGNATENRL